MGIFRGWLSRSLHLLTHARVTARLSWAACLASPGPSPRREPGSPGNRPVGSPGFGSFMIPSCPHRRRLRICLESDAAPRGVWTRKGAGLGKAGAPRSTEPRVSWLFGLRDFGGVDLPGAGSVWAVALAAWAAAGRSRGLGFGGGLDGLSRTRASASTSSNGSADLMAFCQLSKRFRVYSSWE